MYLHLLLLAGGGDRVEHRDKVQATDQLQRVRIAKFLSRLIQTQEATVYLGDFDDEPLLERQEAAVAVR